jgi:hypothetical protein
VEELDEQQPVKQSASAKNQSLVVSLQSPAGCGRPTC